MGSMSNIEFSMKSIGVIHTPFKEKSETPIQFSRSTAMGEIELFPQYEQGLKSIDGLSHLMLLYVFHEALDCQDLLVKPFLDEQLHGVFATRFYCRPNPIGISVVRLIERKGLRLHIQSVDMLDGTPLLDIKPYKPEFDVHKVDKLGWYANRAHR
jgi:tRNA-Thr(GGU) m(6)t(6)A37 methyltransferase TsaA